MTRPGDVIAISEAFSWHQPPTLHVRNGRWDEALEIFGLAERVEDMAEELRVLAEDLRNVADGVGYDVRPNPDYDPATNLTPIETPVLRTMKPNGAKTIEWGQG